jgi:hypothetical protein
VWLQLHSCFACVTCEVTFGINSGEFWAFMLFWDIENGYHESHSFAQIHTSNLSQLNQMEPYSIIQLS